MPDSGFNIMREMNETSSRTKNINTTVRAGIDYSIISKLRFVGLASYTYSTNRLKEIYGDGTKAALDNRMSVDYLSQKEYASVLQRNIDNDSYMTVSYTHLDVYKRQALGIHIRTCRYATPSSGTALRSHCLSYPVLHHDLPV